MSGKAGLGWTGLGKREERETEAVLLSVVAVRGDDVKRNGVGFRVI